MTHDAAYWREAARLLHTQCTALMAQVDELLRENRRLENENETLRREARKEETP